MYEFQCTCGENLRAIAGAEAKTVRCLACRTVFRVPAIRPEAVPVALMEGARRALHPDGNFSRKTLKKKRGRRTHRRGPGIGAPVLGIGLIAALDTIESLCSILLGAVCLFFVDPTVRVFGGIFLGVGLLQIPLIIGYVMLNRTALSLRMGLAFLTLLNAPMGTIFSIFVLITLGKAFDASYATAYLRARRETRRGRSPSLARRVA